MISGPYPAPLLLCIQERLSKHLEDQISRDGIREKTVQIFIFEIDFYCCRYVETGSHSVALFLNSV